MDPTLAIEQARSIEAALISRLPGSQAVITEQTDDLVAELEALDARLATAAVVVGEEPLLFSHPVYQYLIARYGLNAIELHWEPDVPPDGPAWDHLGEAMEEHPAQWLVWEAEPLPTTASMLEERGMASVVFRTCANVPASGEYLTVMATNAEALETIAAALTPEVETVEAEGTEAEPEEGVAVEAEGE